jgi:methylthioribose-1-phosphate isomerase
MEGLATPLSTRKFSESPLLVPVHWCEDHYLVLDETLLPDQVAYLEVGNLDQALAAVKEMKTRAFGQVLTIFHAVALLAHTTREQEFSRLKKQVVEVGERFSQARSTFDFGGLVRLLFQQIGVPSPGTEVGPWLQAKTLDFVTAIVKARNERARQTAELLPVHCRLLTHCNVSGELVAVAQHCQRLGKDLSVIATETRPYFQGARLTAWELSEAGVRVEVIPDSACAQVMAKGEVDAVLVGADRSAQNGDIVNKVGTYSLAVAAHAYGVPFYALVQEPGSLANGSDVPIEERPVRELLTFQGSALAPEGVQGSYPAFDVTPAHLISRLIGFDEVFTPAEYRRKYQKVPVQPAGAAQDKKSFVLVYGVPREDGYARLSSILKAEGAQAFLVPEMRPGLWGAQVVAHKLLQGRVPTTIISDNMMGIFFARGQIRRVLLFGSEPGGSEPKGICGLLLAALLARAHDVPMEILAAAPEETPALDRDVTTFLGHRVCPKGVKAYPIGPDIVPRNLFHDG